MAPSDIVLYLDRGSMMVCDYIPFVEHMTGLLSAV